MIETELQKYYEDRFSMMVTVGWKDFIEDVQTLFDQYNNISTVDDENLSVSNVESLKTSLSTLKNMIVLLVVR